MKDPFHDLFYQIVSFSFQIILKHFRDEVKQSYNLDFFFQDSSKIVPDCTKSKHLLAANKVYPSSFFDSFPFYNLCQVNIEGLKVWEEGLLFTHCASLSVSA